MKIHYIYFLLEANSGSSFTEFKMKHKKYIILALLLFSGLYCSYAQEEKKLAETFIQSLATNNYNLLTPYLPSVIKAKEAFQAQFAGLTPARQMQNIKENLQKLQSKWKDVRANATRNNINFSKVDIKQIILGPSGNDSLSSTLLVTYMYNGIEWDNLLFTINTYGPRFIMDIPHRSETFNFSKKKNGRNLVEMQMEKERHDPQIARQLKKMIGLLKKLAEENNVADMANHLVYRGDEDSANKWKRILRPGNAKEVQVARNLISQIKTDISCPKPEFGEIIIKKESEGVWYVIPVLCGSKKTEYAFLKINNQFALGDIK